MSQALQIDVFSDPACPWCLLGLARLDNAVADLPGDVEVVIVHHSFLLDVSAPAEGSDVFEMLVAKYGVDPNESWDRLEAEAAKAGVTLDMRKQKMRYPTQRAQALIAAGRAKGTQHKLARAIGDAYYLDARNIGDVDVLADVATGFGFTTEEALAIVNDQAQVKAAEVAAASATQQGVQGVPFFVFDQKYALSGAQPQEVFTQVFETVLQERAAAANENAPA